MPDAEYLGFLAALLVVASFFFQNAVLGRVVCVVGAVLWIAYGILVGSASIAVFNSVLVFIQFVRLVRLHRGRNAMPIDGKFKVSVLKQ